MSCGWCDDSDTTICLRSQIDHAAHGGDYVGSILRDGRSSSYTGEHGLEYGNADFNEQWKALEERKENENPDVPKITKALPVIKWTEAFTDYLSCAIGVWMIPLAYVI